MISAGEVRQTFGSVLLCMFVSLCSGYPPYNTTSEYSTSDIISGYPLSNATEHNVENGTLSKTIENAVKKAPHFPVAVFMMLVVVFIVIMGNNRRASSGTSRR